METIVFVDNDNKWTANYKRMLTPFLEEWDCVYFQHPEDAMEYMSSHPTKVLVCELDMPVMSGKELFEMVDMLSPATVKIGITQVRNVASSLEILNQIKIYKLILKPFFVAEDLVFPIREALRHYKENLWHEGTIKKAKKKLQELNQEMEELHKKVDSKKQGHDIILDAMRGILETNLSYPVADFEDEKKELVKEFCAELMQEFFQYYMYEKKNLIFYLSYLKNKFHHPGKNQVFGIRNKFNGKVPVTVMNRIAYVTFLVGYLCEQCLERYHIENMLEAEEDMYVLHIWFGWGTETYGAKVEPDVQKLLWRTIKELMRALSDRMAEKSENKIYALKLYFKREEEQR